MATSNYSSNCLDSGVFLYLEGGRLDWKGKIKKYCKYLSIRNAHFAQMKNLEVRGTGESFAGIAL